MPSSTAVGRIAAALALAGAAVVVLLVILGGGDAYTVTARFANASQLVPGNNVSVAGVPAGSVTEIALADDGQAEVTLELSDDYAPLSVGTHATVRSQSLSGIANRYVSLELPGNPQDGESIADGGVITQADTTSEVDLDQLLNSLDERTVSGLKALIKGFARSYEGVGLEANRGFHYLNPFLSTSRRVFGELNRDQPALERLIANTATLSSTLAARSPELEALVGNLDRMMSAIGARQSELASAIGQLPDFMRQANTTFVNLRAALDDVDPLVEASKPVAKKLQPFARRIRGFARDAVPTIRGLDGIVRRPGAANDLIELTRLQEPLAEIGMGPVQRNGEERPGVLPASARALTESLPQLAFLRPYVTIEGITGWFDDFGHSGFPDALGGVGRIGTTFNPFTLEVIPGVGALPNLARPIDLTGLQDDLGGLTALGFSFNNLRRCPGANERPAPDGSNPFTDPGGQLGGGDLDCDPSQLPIGP